MHRRLALTCAFLSTLCLSPIPFAQQVDGVDGPDAADASDGVDPADPGPSERDAPEISSSRGEEGGVVVFWPRIIPRSNWDVSRDLAGSLQVYLSDLVERTLPGRQIDVRPEPQRVCHRSGCHAMTVGILLLRRESQCVALALVAGSGRAPAKLIPWVGEVQLRRDQVPFREPPENSVVVTDFAHCSEVMRDLLIYESDVAAAILEAAQEPQAN